jgi:hypothetical protein
VAALKDFAGRHAIGKHTARGRHSGNALYVGRAIRDPEPMPDDAEPPRKFYGLKPRDYERVNPTRPPAPVVPPRSEPPVAPPAPDAPIDVRELFRQAQTGQPLLSPRARPNSATNEVHALLRDNHERANAAGLNEVSLRPKRTSKRRRDYWVMMIAGTAVLGTITGLAALRILAGDNSGALFFVYGLAGLVMFNAALWWIMWHIVEDY